MGFNSGFKGLTTEEKPQETIGERKKTDGRPPELTSLSRDRYQLDQPVSGHSTH